MANKRNLKKDIDYLAYEVIADCFTYAQVNGEKNDKKVKQIIGDTIELRNNLIARVNHPDGKDNPKLVKQHFRKIYADLLEGIDKQFNALSEISKK